VILKCRRIRNPLVGVPKEKLFKDIEVFARDNQLTDIVDLLKKGALAAQDPTAIEKIEEFDDSDRAELQYEVTHKWSHPRILYLTIFLNSVAAAIQGWDQTGVCSTRVCPVVAVSAKAFRF
jgi:hypothetical protein